MDKVPAYEVIYQQVEDGGYEASVLAELSNINFMVAKLRESVSDGEAVGHEVTIYGPINTEALVTSYHDNHVEVRILSKEDDEVFKVENNCLYHEAEGLIKRTSYNEYFAVQSVGILRRALMSVDTES